MRIIQDIGSYAGLGAVLGLAVLSALYFSQARDVKRLREWAGRAPERTSQAQPAPQRVTAVPQGKAKPAAPGPQAPAQPAAAQQGGASAAGAAPAQARPAAATPAAQGKQPAPATAEAKPAAAQGKEPDASVEAKQPAAVAAAAGAAPAAQSAEAKSDQPSSSAGTAAPAGKPGAAADSGAPAAPKQQGSPAAAPSKPGDDASRTAGPAAATPAGTRPGQTEPPPVPKAKPASRPIPSFPSSRPGGGDRPGPSQTAILPPYGGEDQRRPWHRRLLASPRYLVLAIAGVLVVGGAAAFGLTELSKKQAPPPKPQPIATNGGPSRATGRKPAAINPSSVTVSVLNGTTVPGLAAQIGDRIGSLGFKLGNVTNSSDQQRAESVVLFAPGAAREASFVGRKLSIAQREPIDPQSRALAGDARIVVITGADKTR